jgi:hypothetical protein
MAVNFAGCPEGDDRGGWKMQKYRGDAWIEVAREAVDVEIEEILN